MNVEFNYLCRFVNLIVTYKFYLIYVAEPLLTENDQKVKKYHPKLLKY